MVSNDPFNWTRNGRRKRLLASEVRRCSRLVGEHEDPSTFYRVFCNILRIADLKISSHFIPRFLIKRRWVVDDVRFVDLL